MDTLLDFVKRIHFPRLSIFFRREGFHPALSVLVDVIDNPSLFLFARPRCPFALADTCHC
jgi:hypothetical protein